MSGLNDIVDERDKKPMPQWVPISLLALTTVALGVPIVLLRRQRTGMIPRSVKDAPPPRRTGGAVNLRTVPTKPQISRPAPSSSAVPPPLRARPSPTPANPAVANPDADFNGALYSMKAFGIATMIVSAGAVTTVLGVKVALGVQDTKEFAQKMRQLIMTRMPVLSSRIHRAPDADDHPADWIPVDPNGHTFNTQVTESEKSEQVEWSWPAAEERLGMAYQERGVRGWAEAVMHELEAEGQTERKKRGHS
ncbi:hypothetical protein EIP91_000525 [Steccherinum ochraceum]|uniref:Uncharacterized protein n=1 Tax=Steccherinum ochraceum TaxID=92696 RepID=A0A4R0RT01_9APHY|nr:hypothetical protein EIP91_000525 [Steccherinum ochraceum]